MKSGYDTIQSAGMVWTLPVAADQASQLHSAHLTFLIAALSLPGLNATALHARIPTEPWEGVSHKSLLSIKANTSLQCLLNTLTQESQGRWRKQKNHQRLAKKQRT